MELLKALLHLVYLPIPVKFVEHFVLKESILMVSRGHFYSGTSINHSNQKLICKHDRRYGSMDP